MQRAWHCRCGAAVYPVRRVCSGDLHIFISYLVLEPILGGSSSMATLILLGLTKSVALTVESGSRRWNPLENARVGILLWITFGEFSSEFSKLRFFDNNTLHDNDIRIACDSYCMLQVRSACSSGSVIPSQHGAILQCSGPI